MSEYERKAASMRNFMAEQGVDALLLKGVANFAWATCGAASYVNTATSTGEAWLLITADAKQLFANNIEAARLEGEEGLVDQGWAFVVNPWYEGTDALAEATAGMKIGADVPYPGAVDISGALAEYRTHLSPEEQERFRLLSQRCGEAMNDAIRAVKPGMTEYEIAALLGYETQRRGAQPIVNLIAVDENIYSYRHPLPTAKVMERYAMLVLCGRWKGLVSSVTRLVHFGKLPDELRQKANAVAEIDATFIAATRPGASLGQIFASAQAAYAATGYRRRVDAASSGRSRQLRAARLRGHARRSPDRRRRPGLCLESLDHGHQIRRHDPGRRNRQRGLDHDRRLAHDCSRDRWAGDRAARYSGNCLSET